MKILVCYRGSDIGRDLLQLAARHAQAFTGEIIVITSLMGGDRTTRDKVEKAEKNLEMAESFFSDQGLTCTTHLLIRNNTAGEDIVSFAREHDVDEIVIGVKSRSKVGKLLFGSTAQYVILRAHCPVVTAK
ncbi:MAG: universal stress protein [Desulfopila sp.]